MILSTDISYKHVAWLLLILFCGSLLRFYALGGKGLWWDEFQTLQISAGPCTHHGSTTVHSPLAVLQAVKASGQRPLYFMLLNIWMRVFGTSEAGIRSLSALLGIAAIWFMYQVTNELLNESIGLISLLILGLAPFHVYYSQ